MLSKYLDTQSTKNIMNEIFKIYVSRFDELYKHLDIFSSAAKNRYECIFVFFYGRLLIDVQFFTLRFSSFDGIDGPGNALEVAVNNIKIRDKRQQVVDSKLNAMKKGGK